MVGTGGSFESQGVLDSSILCSSVMDAVAGCLVLVVDVSDVMASTAFSRVASRKTLCNKPIDSFLRMRKGLCSGMGNAKADRPLSWE